MNIIDLIQEQSSSYTKNEQDIACYIINHPTDAGRYTIEKLAVETNTSKAALIRFAKKLGFSGYSEFKYALNRFLVSNNAEVSTNYHEDSPVSITNIYINALQEFNKYITDEQLHSLACKIKKSKKNTYPGPFQIRTICTTTGRPFITYRHRHQICTGFHRNYRHFEPVKGR